MDKHLPSSLFQPLLLTMLTMLLCDMYHPDAINKVDYHCKVD